MISLRFPSVLAAGLLLGSALPATVVGQADKAYQSAARSLDVVWITVSPVNPRNIYIGVMNGNYLPTSDRVMGSTDGGTTFKYVPRAMDACEPFLFGPGGTSISGTCGDDNAADQYTLRSADGKLWNDVPYNQVAISPLKPYRWYGVQSDFQSPDSGGGCFSTVGVSIDTGRRWREASTPPDIAPMANDSHSATDKSGSNEVNSLVADPTRANTVYANYTDCDYNSTSLVASSQDGGVNWTMLSVPDGLQTFVVHTDSHEPGLLVGTTEDQGIPADRIYLSRDQGQTWSASTCPGQLHGICPIAVVDNVFGAGQSYAFLQSGIYAFKRSGPARARLAISTRLPVPASRIDDARAGSHLGDPIYLLGNTADGNHTYLYRSTNSGVTWKALPVRTLPH